MATPREHRRIGAQHGGRAHRHCLGIGRSVPAITGDPILAGLEWEPEAPPDGAAVEEKLKGIAKSMPFAISLLGSRRTTSSRWSRPWSSRAVGPPYSP
jgi:hypothetical protein